MYVCFWVKSQNVYLIFSVSSQQFKFRIISLGDTQRGNSLGSLRLIKCSLDVLHWDSGDKNSPTSSLLYSPELADRISQYVCSCSFPATPFTLSRNRPKSGSSFTVNLQHTQRQNIYEKQNTEEWELHWGLRYVISRGIKDIGGLTWSHAVFPAVSWEHPEAPHPPPQSWNRA